MKRQWDRRKGARSGLYQVCLHCGKEKYYIPSQVKKSGGKYCSQSCRAKAYYPVNLKSFSGGIIARNAGRKALLRFAKAVRKDGSKHARWMGDSVKYGALHGWIANRKGKPSRCEACGTTDPKERYEWANIDHQYRRNVDDFARMCVTCHRIFDYMAARERRRRYGSSHLPFVPKT